MTEAMWKKIPIHLIIAMSGEQIKRIPASTLAKFGDDVWKRIPIHLITKLSIEAIQAFGKLEHLNATAIGAIAADKWKGIPVEVCTVDNSLTLTA